MRWENESYVKIYTRDTPEFLSLPWQARCLLHELVRKVDRVGVLKVGKLGPFRGVALTVRAPEDEIREPVQLLLDEGRLSYSPERGELVVPNHVAAQGASQSDAARKQRSRDLARARDVSGDTLSRGHTSRDRTSLKNRSDQIRSEDPPLPPEGGTHRAPELESPAVDESPSGVHELADAPLAPRSDLGGLEADVWADAISAETGEPCAPPRGTAAIQALRDGLKYHGPKGATALDRQAWLRTAVRDYARARRGSEMNPRWFVEWLNAGRPVPRAGPLRAVQQAPVTGSIWKVGDGT